MPLNARLNVNDNIFTVQKPTTEVLDITQEVDNTNGFIELVSFSTTKGTNTLTSSRGLCIYNQSPVCAEVQILVTDWKDSSDSDIANSVDLGPGSATTTRYVTFLLPANDFTYLPNSRFISYAEDASGANATSISNTAPNSNMYVDSTADVDSATANGIVSSASDTTLYLEPYTSAANCTANLFKIGDLIRVRDEVMEVTAIGDKSDLANNKLTVKRGLFGSSAVTAGADEDAVRFAFFNKTDNYNAFSTSRTDKTGRFHAMNFFGYGRNLTGVADGIVPGSVALKFYEPAYQELGLSGLSPGSNTGLTAGSTYYFKITVDGGSQFEVGFTVDQTNTNLGGANGVLNQIQNIFNQQFYTTGAALNGVKVNVGIVNGDIRFTSGSHLSTSSIALAAGTSGADTTTEIFAQAIGIFPALAGVESAVASKLPDDTLKDKATYKDSPNNVFMFDDGKGSLQGVGNGSINYETGEINFIGPVEAEFVVSASYFSAHSGGISTETDNFNNIQSISARSCNQKQNATIKILGFN